MCSRHARALPGRSGNGSRSPLRLRDHPYDATHLGHAFNYVSIDLVVRAWWDAGLGVRYAQNVTDVDDPLLERAAATTQDWWAWC